MQLPDGYNSKEDYVHDLFEGIAHRYDLLNTLLSFNRDKYWRRFAVGQTGFAPGGTAIDVCCGTGMLALELAKVAGPQGQVVGVDFAEAMLAVAKRRLARHEEGQIIELVRGNAVDLPFPDNTFDCAIIGFALRNVPSIEKTIREMQRVIRPGGRVVSLELAKPGAFGFKHLYYLYFFHLVPVLGRIGLGRGGPYNYLPSSLKEFPHQKEIKALFCRVGLRDVALYELSGGIVAVHVGSKAYET